MEIKRETNTHTDKNTHTQYAHIKQHKNTYIYTQTHINEQTLSRTFATRQKLMKPVEAYPKKPKKKE